MYYWIFYSLPLIFSSPSHKLFFTFPASSLGVPLLTLSYMGSYKSKKGGGGNNNQYNANEKRNNHYYEGNK